MARSSFRLPDIQELNKDQRNALSLPNEGRHLIVGGPGTGKSVVALARARKLKKEKVSYLFLVYNNLLDTYGKDLTEKELKTKTYIKWFKRSFKEWFGVPLPEAPYEVKRNDRVLEYDSKEGFPDKPEQGEEKSVYYAKDTEIFYEWFRNRYTEKFRDIDWAAIEGLNPKQDMNFDTSLYLIIDEGQDMPKEFYSTLIRVGFENFYVVADQNQRITEHNSNIKELRKVLVIEKNEVIELKKNYRNTRSIALLAKHFCTNDPGSPPIDLPDKEKNPRTPVLRKYSSSEANTLYEDILKMWDRNTDKLIGIITHLNNTRKAFIHGIENSEVDLDHEMPEIQTYSSSDGRTAVNFRDGGIMVINQPSCKGLEFDIVILADIDDHWAHSKDGLMKKFYVMVSRGRDEVTLLRKGNARPEVERIMPAVGSKILERV